MRGPARQVAAPTLVARPTLRLGDLDQQVDVAQQKLNVHSAPRADRGDKALAVVQGHGLTQGAFAQQVARRYVVFFGVDVVDDVNANVDEAPTEPEMTKQRLCTQPFLYTADNLLGGAETANGPNALLVEPRHVRHLARIVAAGLGGIWEPRRR